MKGYSLFLLIGLFCLLGGCSDDEDVTPSMKDEDRLESLIDKSNADIMAFKEKYGTYILYEFDQLLDFAYQFDEAGSWREAKLTRLTREDVPGAVTFLKDHFWSCYGDSLITNCFPRKFLICSKIYASALGISGEGNTKMYHDAAANMNSFTVACLDKKTLSEMEAERQGEYVRQLHYIYLCGYLVNVRRDVFVEDIFFDPASKLYGTKIDRKTGMNLDEEYFMNRGFFYIESTENYYPQQMEDLMIFTEKLVKMDQHIHDVVMEKSIMRNKMQYVAQGLKAIGVDIAQINPLAKDFL